MKTLALVLKVLVLLHTATGQPFNAYYISPQGDDSAVGNSIQNPLATISKGFELAQAGDTLYLLPGTHMGRNRISGKHGSPDLPITLKSYSKEPSTFAIIDAQSKPTTEDGNEGLVVMDCSWIDIENIVFRNCWASVILIRSSSYISIRSCHFTTGKRIIHAIGNETHHVLVENCFVKHPEEVWRGWSWESLHHGEVSYYNGALLHPNQSGGGHIMRGNTLINVFNAFRTRPKSIMEDGNTEVYGNTMINIRDNEFEPETWAWNMHYAYNEHINIHKMYSIDGVKGGNIYIYGNTYTQTLDPWATEEVSGIFKYSEGPLTYPCYAFNNSYYTEAKVLRKGESTNHQLKHFNNAYHFFEGSDRFELTEWQEGFEFDYDCINQDWPPNMYAHDQEEHGLKFTEPKFVDGLKGDFRLQANSACVDAGKIMRLPEYDWIQSFEGEATDIGAYEGDQLIDGPPFRFLPSPEGAFYQEKPRISKHTIKGNELRLYFTAAIDPQTVSAKQIKLFQQGEIIVIDRVDFPNHAFEMILYTSHQLDGGSLSLLFDEKPVGQNGQQFTYWGSSIPIGKTSQNLPDLESIPALHSLKSDVPSFDEVKLVILPTPVRDSIRAEIIFPFEPPMKYINHIAIYDLHGDELFFLYEPSVSNKRVIFKMEHPPLEPGNYLAKTRVGVEIITTEFTVAK